MQTLPRGGSPLTFCLPVQLPGGERVPFFFTIKQLVAKATSPAGLSPGTEFGGTFTVPSYRSGLFLDPKVGPRDDSCAVSHHAGRRTEPPVPPRPALLSTAHTCPIFAVC
jgi:hypothetical protein